MEVKNVEITKIETKSKQELSDILFRMCSFCEKLTLIDQTNTMSCLNISKANFYCPFCIRNNHHHCSSKNILMLSFRAIIGYYYYKFYIERNSQWVLYANDIERYIEKHVNLGLMNPVFSYDPHTFIWFVDFNRVGTGARKAPIEEIIKTARSVYDCFLVKDYCYNSEELMWVKFSKSIKLFNEKRKRPSNKRMLIPTLEGIVSQQEDDQFWKATREFLRSDLNVK